MAPQGTASFRRHFEELQDPRVERTRRHPLINIVFMTVCGVLSGANSIAGIHEFAIDRRSWLARYLDLSSGIPSEDTFGRVLARLDPAAFEKCLLGGSGESQKTAMVFLGRDVKRADSPCSLEGELVGYI